MLCSLPWGDEQPFACTADIGPMPHTTRDDTRCSRTQLYNLLSVSNLENHIDCTRQKKQEFISFWVHLPLDRIVGHQESPHESSVVEVKLVVDLGPEVVTNIDRHCATFIGKSHIGTDKIKCRSFKSTHLTPPLHCFQRVSAQRASSRTG